MTIPVWVLLAFAVWTMVTLMITVGTYRWSLILTGRRQANEFRAYDLEGSDFYKRSMRAHLNCVENLPVYGAIVVAIVVSGAASSTLNVLALVFMGARLVQTSIHLGDVHRTNLFAYVRFSFFFVQLICMLWMAFLVVQHAA